jgi:MFS family permease
LGGESIATNVVISAQLRLSPHSGSVLYTIFIGFTSGTITSGVSTAFSLFLCAKDPRDFGTYMGIGLWIASLAALIGPPVSGVLFDNYGFLQFSIFSGIMVFVSGCI